MGMVPRPAQAIGRGTWRRAVSAGVAVLAALGTLAGVLVALGGAPAKDLAAHGQFALPSVRPSTGAVISGVPLTLSAGATLIPDAPVPAVKATSAPGPAVTPLRRTVQADLLIVAPSSLPSGLLGGISKLPGMIAAQQIEAVRMPINGIETAVVGADPSQFRSFAAAPTGAANALWQGVADGGIAVSYEMGKLAKLPLGGSVRATGRTTKQLRVVAFGTLGIGGVNAVVSDATAEALGAPAGNAIVVSVQAGNFNADSAAIRELLPKGAGIEPLVSLVSSAAAGAGPATAAGAPGTAIHAMLSAAISRQGQPYVWGAAGPTEFDCSGWFSGRSPRQESRCRVSPPTRHCRARRCR